MGLTDAVETPIVVAIATRDRPDLLQRTLLSLAECTLPAGFEGAIVAENGGGRAAEEVVDRISAPFPIEYLHVPEAGKNRALNATVSMHPGAFIIFFDDDVRISPQALEAYRTACDRTGRRTFFGGRCNVDYEQSPPQWMYRYLPSSAKGWQPSSAPCAIASAMGFNWGAFASDIINAGGFLTTLGPGTWRTIGDETEMQRRLIQHGGRGEYLPEAIVWHYVPKERCSEAWVVQRAYQRGVARGLQLANWPEAERDRFAASCRTKARALKVALSLFRPFLNRRLVCHYRWARQWKLGVLCGLQMLIDKGQLPSR